MIILPLTLIFIFGGFRHGWSYENLSRRNSTVLSQSSTWNGHVASFANDGDLRTVRAYCAYTAPNHTLAWFQVDVGSPYNIHSVKIYYRNDGEGAWYQYRFRQFHLDVSDLPANQTTTGQRTRCYTDNTTVPNLPPNIIDIPCKHTARYVIVETTYDAPEDNPTTGAFLEICEIEVYGCSPNCLNNVCGDNGDCTQGCVAGYWGQTCESACPVNCTDQCDRQYGRCSGACPQGYWGEGCNTPCSAHCSGSACDTMTGKCTQGCDVGWYGDTCNNACSPRCATGSCERQTGICSAGCAQNWTGDRCDSCDVTHYGPDCSRECSVNCIQKTCNNITGSCTQGCKTGLYGDTCNKSCSSCPEGCNQHTGECEGACPVGKFGARCEKACSPNCQSECNKNTGVCTQGCKTGFYGDLCNNICSGCPKGCNRHTGVCDEACLIGNFGTSCEETCSTNCQNGCDRNTGVCTSCTDGMFGRSCNQICSSGCVSGCDQYNASCACKPGWQGDMCTVAVITDRQLAESTTKQTTNYQPESTTEQTSDNQPILYGVIVLLCLSLALNIFSFTWMLRKGMCRRQNNSQFLVNKIALPPVVYDSVEDNTGYQELGELSGPSLYEQLDK